MPKGILVDALGLTREEEECLDKEGRRKLGRGVEKKDGINLTDAEATVDGRNSSAKGLEEGRTKAPVQCR